MEEITISANGIRNDHLLNTLVTPHPPPRYFFLFSQRVEPEELKPFWRKMSCTTVQNETTHVMDRWEGKM